MGKAYIIVHDDENLLVGEGGKTGNYKKERKGYHLPGGTIDTGETAEQAVIRELMEETGIELPLEAIEANIAATSVPEAQFIVAKVSSVKELVSNFTRPEITEINEFDEPFYQLRSLPSDGSWTNDNFKPDFKTDWFQHGLLAAQEFIVLKENA